MGQSYAEEDCKELKKPVSKVYVPRGHGVQFRDGSWMTGWPAERAVPQPHGLRVLCALPEDRVRAQPGW